MRFPPSSWFGGAVAMPPPPLPPGGGGGGGGGSPWGSSSLGSLLSGLAVLKAHSGLLFLFVTEI